MANAIEMTEATPQKRREILEQSFGGNQPMGLALLDEQGDLSARVLVRQGTAAELDEIVLGDGEIAIERDASGDPTGFRAGNGATAGGVPIIGKQKIYSTEEDITTTQNTLDYEIIEPLSFSVPPGRYHFHVHLAFFANDENTENVNCNFRIDGLEVMSGIRTFGSSGSTEGSGYNFGNMNGIIMGPIAPDDTRFISAMGTSEFSEETSLNFEIRTTAEQHITLWRGATISVTRLN